MLGLVACGYVFGMCETGRPRGVDPARDGDPQGGCDRVLEGTAGVEAVEGCGVCVVRGVGG